jgi:AraC-like DNA-binding protein
MIMFISFTTFILLALLAISLLMTESAYKKSNYLLALLFVLLSAKMLMITVRFWNEKPDAYGLSSIIAISLGPVIYSYVSSVLEGKRFTPLYIVRHSLLVVVMLILQWEPLEASILKDILIISSLSIYSISVPKLIISNQIEQAQQNDTAARVMRFLKLLAIFLIIMTLFDIIIFVELFWLGTIPSSVGLNVAISFLATVSLVITYMWLNRSQLISWIFAAKYNSQANDAQYTPEEKQKIISQLKATVEVNQMYLSSELSIQTVAATLGVSPRLISNAVNQYLGKTFRRYINDLRITQAKRMLTETDSTVLAIMFNVGFETKSNFNKEFQQNVGMSPLAYRKSSRK